MKMNTKLMVLIAFLGFATFGYSQSTTDVAKGGSAVKTIDNKGTIKFFQAGNGITQIVNTTSDLTTTTWELGGTLTSPTTITTTASETLSIAGLQAGDLATDEIVVSTPTGELKKVAASTLLLSGTTNFNAPTLGQDTYLVSGMPATASKVWVYRNGVKLISGVDYTTVAGTMTLVPAIASLIETTDNIEVQWVK